MGREETIENNGWLNEPREGRPHGARRNSVRAELPELREAVMPLYRGLGRGGEKIAVVLDLGEAFTK